MGIQNIEKSGIYRLTLWSCGCLGIGASSILFLVGCGPNQDASSSTPSDTFSSSKPVGSTTLSHGGPTLGPSQNRTGLEDSRIGQRVMVRSPSSDNGGAPLPLLSVPPDIFDSEVEIRNKGDLTVLPGSMVTIVEIAHDRSYRMIEESTISLEDSRVFLKVKREDGVQGWVQEDYLAVQESTIRESR